MVQILTGKASPQRVLLASLITTGSSVLKIPVWSRTLLHLFSQLEWRQGMFCILCTFYFLCRLPGGVVTRHREGVPSQDYRHLWSFVPCHLLTDIQTIFAGDFLLFGYSALEYLKAAGSKCLFHWENYKKNLQHTTQTQQRKIENGVQ